MGMIKTKRGWIVRNREDKVSLKFEDDEETENFQNVYLCWDHDDLEEVVFYEFDGGIDVFYIDGGGFFLEDENKKEWLDTHLCTLQEYIDFQAEQSRVKEAQMRVLANEIVEIEKELEEIQR